MLGFAFLSAPLFHRKRRSSSRGRSKKRLPKPTDVIFSAFFGGIPLTQQSVSDTLSGRKSIEIYIIWWIPKRLHTRDTRLCFFFAVLGLKPPEHGVICGAFLLGVGIYLTSLFFFKNPCVDSVFTAEKEQCNNADGSYLSSSFNNLSRPF